MKKLLFFLLLPVVSWADISINGGQNIAGQLTVSSSITVNGLSAGQCVQTGADGLLQSAGSACNTSSSGIQNTSTLQSGATFYVSSGTIAGNFNATGSGIFGDGSTGPIEIFNVKANNHSAGTFYLVGNSATNGDANFDYYTAGIPGGLTSRFRITNTNLASGITEDRYRSGWNFEDGNGKVLVAIQKTGGLVINSTGTLSLYDGGTSHFVALKASNTVSSNVTWIMPSSDTQGIVQSDGSGNLSISATISSTTASGYFVLPSATLSYLAATTPSSIGEQFYCSNCTTDAVCVSTQTATATWARTSSKATACQ